MARKAKTSGDAAVFTVNSPTGLNVREMPDRAAKVVSVLPHGETVEQAGNAPQGWLAVSGGYVMREYLK